MKTYHDVAVVNASTGMTNVITLVDGAFNVPGNVAIDTTNKGWGDTKKIMWPNVLSVTKTAAAAGTYRKMKFDMTGVTPVAGTVYYIRVYQKDKDHTDTNPLFDKTVKVVAVTGETDLSLALKFYNSFLAMSKTGSIVVTNAPVGSSEYFYIEAQFGTAGLEIYDMGTEYSLPASSVVTQTTQTFAQVAGSVDLVDHYADGYATATHTYTTYEFLYLEPVESAPDGHFALKPKTGVVFVEDDEAAEFLAEFNIIFSGLKKGDLVACSGLSEANPGVFSKVAHGMTTGDAIILEGWIGDAYSEDYPALNGLVGTIVEGADADKFTFKVDGTTALNTTGYTAAFSAGGYRKLDPYKSRAN